MNKLNYLSLAAIATFGLASCSSDEPANGSNDQNVNGEHYMAVTIRTAGMGGTKASEEGSPAVGNPEFEDAVGTEGDINADNIYFYFYDPEGNPFQLAAANVNGTVATNVVQPVSINKEENNGTEPTITGVLVLGKAVGTGYVGTTPAQMLCVANPTAANLETYANTPLSQVLAVMSSNSDLPSCTNFVMTNSTYVENGEVKTAVDVADKFYSEPTAAQADPATIYLERLTAKVRVTGLGDYEPQYRNAQGTIVENFQWTVNNNPVNLQVTLDGWRLNNISTRSRAFKNVAADGNYFANWNDPTLHRCYWAISNVSNPLENTTFNIYDESAWGRGNFVSTNPTNNIAYVYENTQWPNCDLTDRVNNSATGIVVKGTVKMENADGVYQPVELVQWAGAYYTEDVLKQMIIDNYNVANGTSLTSSAVEFVKYTDVANMPNRYYAQINNNGSTVNWDTNYGNLRRWIGGATSYYLNIEHHGGLMGVVRNHIYDYEFTGVVGLGVPGNDPENPEPEDETFLAARVAVLNWHVISNKFVLE